MDYAGFLKEVERGATPLVCLLHGPDPFLLNEALAHVTRACCPDSSLVLLNRECFDARETGSEAIARSALTLPCLAPARLVVVRESQALAFDPRANVREYRLWVTLNLQFRDVRKNLMLWRQEGLQEKADFRIPGQVAETISREESALRQAAVDIGRAIVTLAVERF